MARVADRLRRVEAVRKPPSGGVLVQRPGETVDDTLQRAGAAGRTGAFVVVPPAVDVNAWSAQCSAYMAQQQRDSVAELQRLIDTASRARS